MELSTNSVGRPAHPKELKARALQIRCTDAEWEELLKEVPRDTRTRFVWLRNLIIDVQDE